MLVARMHAAVGQQAHDVQDRARRARRVHGLDEGRIILDAPVAAGVVDAGELLEDHAAGADIKVPYFGITHLARGQAHRLAGSLDLHVGEPLPESVDMRRARLGDRVAGTGRCDTEPVHDDESRRQMIVLVAHRKNNSLSMRYVR